MDCRSLFGRWALVTGAGSGIGRASALAFAERGADVAICDIHEERLEETAAELRALGREVLAQKVDVASAEEMSAFADAVHERTPAVDLLMNNAGVALGASFLDTSLEDWRWILDINLRGVIHGCHFFLPKMVERRRGGHVVNVASAAGYVAGETLCAYSTTKFAVVGLSESIREEVARHGIGVTALCPGLIYTSILHSAELRGQLAERPEARERMISVFQRRNYTPARVARNMLRAIEKNRAVAPITPESWTLYYLKRLVPGFVRWVSRTQGDRARREFGVG